MTDMTGEPALTPARRLVMTSALLAVLLFWMQRYQILLLFGWRYTDEDQALLAFILRDVQSGTVHAPTFYGQGYGNWIESAIAALFTPAAVSPLTTLPLATQLLFWLPFAALASAEWRAGRLLVANVLLWVPCLMPDRADLLFSIPRAWLPGISLAMMGATLLRTRPLALGAVMVCAVTLNSAAGLLVLPVLIEAVGRERHDRPFLTRLGLGLALGTLHPIALRTFDLRHPGWNIHPSPSWDWSVARLIEGISTLGLPIGVMLWPTALLFAAALLCGRLSSPARTALAAFTAALVLSLGFEKVWDGRPSVFFPHERAYLALPYVGAWALWLSLSRPRWTPPASAPALAGGTLALLLLAIVLTTDEVARPDSVREELGRSEGSVVAPRRVVDLLRVCAVADAEARKTDAAWVVFRHDRAAAYACGALWHGRIETLHPSYERRQWLLARFRPERVLWQPPLSSPSR